MPHDEAIIEAGRKFLAGQGYETIITEPDVGGGESPDLIGWRLAEHGPDEETGVVECKRSIEDAEREPQKPREASHRCGNWRWLLTPISVWNQRERRLRRVCEQLEMGLLVWMEGGELDEMMPTLYHHDKARRTEARLRRDEFNRMKRRIAELEGTATPKRNGSTSTGLKPYHHDMLDTWLGDSAGLKEVAAVLVGCDDRLTRNKALKLAHEAMRDGVPGFQVVQSGQDLFLERA